MVGDPCEQALPWGLQPALQPLPWRLQDPPPWSPFSLPEPLLWLVDCRDPLPPAAREALLATLTTAEQQRCNAYRLPDDRERFLRARAGLRLLLGAWQGCYPSAVVLEIGTHGKPFCPGGPQFNLSHSGDLIVLALHPRYRVGVDVEEIRSGLNWQPIAERVLTKSQQELLLRLPAASQSMAFLTGWCALEAELKAMGSGFSGLKQGKGASSDPGQDAGLRWELKLPQGYTGVTVVLPESTQRS
jgi:4'-phosphopantetheinyl transferase